MDEFVPEFVPPSHSVPILCLLLGLSATCYLLWQLWWPSSDSAAAAKATLVPPLSSWGAARVVAFLSANTDLELVRGSDAHFFRSNFSNVDGEMLLDMTNEDFVSKGVKPYHLMKIKRVLADIALENSRDRKGIVMRAIDPLS